MGALRRALIGALLGALVGALTGALIGARIGALIGHSTEAFIGALSRSLDLGLNRSLNRSPTTSHHRNPTPSLIGPYEEPTSPPPKPMLGPKSLGNLDIPGATRPFFLDFPKEVANAACVPRPSGNLNKKAQSAPRT